MHTHAHKHTHARIHTYTDTHARTHIQAAAVEGTGGHPWGGEGNGGQVVS
jgi:hypothetical protein